MTLFLGTLDGLIGNLFTTAPAVLSVAGALYLSRKGFFGPHQR